MFGVRVGRRLSKERTPHPHDHDNDDGRPYDHRRPHHNYDRTYDHHSTYNNVYIAAAHRPGAVYDDHHAVPAAADTAHYDHDCSPTVYYYVYDGAGGLVGWV